MTSPTVLSSCDGGNNTKNTITGSSSSSSSSSSPSSSSSLCWGYIYIGIGVLLLIGPIFGIDWDRPQLRILTFLPAAIVICICHWVSLRIYLRR
jgi:hypothetical protein